MNTAFWWAYVCTYQGMAFNDEFDSWCAGPRSMDCRTEQALTA